MQDEYREWVYNEIFRVIWECARRRSAAFTPTWATPLRRAGRWPMRKSKRSLKIGLRCWMKNDFVCFSEGHGAGRTSAGRAQKNRSLTSKLRFSG